MADRLHGTPEEALDQALSRMRGLVEMRRDGSGVHWSLMLAHLNAYEHKWLPLALERAVVEARADGASWNDIGTRLGMTKQAAQQRFGGSPAGTRRTRAVASDEQLELGL